MNRFVLCSQGHLVAIAVILFACGSMLPGATVTVVARPYLSSDWKLKPRIRLLGKRTRRDLWPPGEALVAHRIPSGVYEMEAFQPGFKTARQTVYVFSDKENVQVRLVLKVSEEATGLVVSATGAVVRAKSYEDAWVLVFPLTGDSSGVGQAQVDRRTGTFRIAVEDWGPYILTVVRGDEVLSTRKADFGARNEEIRIDVGERP